MKKLTISLNWKSTWSHDKKNETWIVESVVMNHTLFQGTFYNIVQRKHIHVRIFDT